MMALAGISHGGQNDTFNEVAAVEQKVQTAALCGAIKKAYGVKAVERKPLIGHESLLAWQAETAALCKKGWGIPAGAVETPTSIPVESTGAKHYQSYCGDGVMPGA